MPLYLSDLTAPFLKSSLAHLLTSARILALFFCDILFGPARPEDTLTALLSKANYAAAFQLQLCGDVFPAVDNWLTFLPSAKACVEVPWFFALLGALVWAVGWVALVCAVGRAAWVALRAAWWAVYFLLECVGGSGYWAVGVLGGWLGMKEEGEVPVVVVVDTEAKGL